MSDHISVNQPLDQWLAVSRESLLAKLLPVLDIEAGLRSVIILEAHSALGDNLDEILDFQAGMHEVFNGDLARPLFDSCAPTNATPSESPRSAPAGLLESIVQDIAGLRSDLAHEAFKVVPVTKLDLIEPTSDLDERKRGLRAAYRALTYLANGLNDRTISRNEAFDALARARDYLLLAAEKNRSSASLSQRLDTDRLASERFIRKLDAVGSSVARLFDSTDNHTPALKQ